MGRNILNYKLSKEYVLSKVSQITIFSTYLNIPDYVIKDCINNNTLITSPLREDTHPTCGFRYDNKGKLKFKDFAGYFWGDCFDVVALIISNVYNRRINVNNKEDFIFVLKHITFTFKNIFYDKEKDINLINSINTSIDNLKRQKPIIELVTRQWNEDDIKYWSKFKIGIKELNINFVHPIDQYYINRNVNPEPKYFYNKKDPCYAYILGVDKNGIYNIKLYFPFRNKSENKFITNSNILEGIYLLNDKNYDIIIITKSSKDRISMFCAYHTYQSLYGGDIKIGFINIPHETYKIKQNEYDYIRDKLDKDGIILSLMDNDRVGKKEAIWLKQSYSIQPLLIDKKYKAKDFAELMSKYNQNDIITKSVKILKNIYNERKDNKYNTTIRPDNTMPF